MSRVSAVLAAAMIALPAVAKDRASSPFHDHPVEVAQAAALIFVAADREGSDARLVAASLKEANPDLGDGPGHGDIGVRGGQALVPTELADDPSFAAAVLATVLLSERGLAEAYEEAAEGDDGSLDRARALLDQVNEMAPPLLARLPEAEAAEAGDLLARLNALLPAGETPAFSDPEDVEVQAQALTGLMQRGLGVDLYMARDLSRALATVRHLADGGCAEGEGEGGEDVGREMIAIAQFYHEDALEAPLSVLVPDLQESAEEAYETILGGSDPGACADLVATLDEVGATLFPEAGQ